MKHCFAFYFAFDDPDMELTDEEQEAKSTYAFIPLKISNLTDQHEDIILKACNTRNLEHNPYGIHDVSFGETFVHDGQEYESIFGFSTYEVVEDRIDELMDIWKDILTNECGLKTGPVIKMKGNDYHTCL